MKKIILAAIAALFLTSCYEETTAGLEQAKTEQNQQKLFKAQEPASLDWSLERDNINKRTLEWNDPDKVSYIYLLAYGRVMAFYAIKGKVSSVNSQITNPMQLLNLFEGWQTLPSPAEDGSYGTNGDAIFFFTTDDAYVEWNGEYMLCDQELQLTTPPAITVVRREK